MRVVCPIAVTILICANLFTGQSSQAAPSRSEELKAAIDPIFADVDPKGPGAFVTVDDNEKTMFQKGYGLANVKKQIPFTSTSVFDLASCSKQFTAMAVLILADRGKLSVDDDVCKYFPALKKLHSRKTIRIRNLMDMTSGLADYSASYSEEQLATKTPTDVLNWTSKQPVKFQPGNKWDYNNGNYSLLALLVERVAKVSFPQFMQKEIFGPLGMTRTRIMASPEEKIPNRAGTYTEKNHKIKWSRLDTHIYGDGQVMTTPDDFAIWDKSLRKFSLVKPTTLKQAFTGGKLNNGTPTQYGFGWSVEKVGRRNTVNHEGNWNGTSTYIVRFLNSGISVMVLSNNDNFGSGEKGNEIAKAVFKIQSAH